MPLVLPWDILSSRKGQAHLRPLPFHRPDIQLNFQVASQFSAQIKPHSCGTAPAAPVASCKAFVENAGNLVGGYADTVVADGELYLVSHTAGGEGDQGMLAPVTYRVLQELPQDKTEPFAQSDREM